MIYGFDYMPIIPGLIAETPPETKAEEQNDKTVSLLVIALPVIAGMTAFAVAVGLGLLHEMIN